MEEYKLAFEYLSRYLSESRLSKIHHNIESKTNYILPILEDIYQYRNAAAIVRSVEGFGINTMYAIDNKYPFKPEESVSRGAEKWVDVIRKKDIEEVVSEVKGKGYKIAAVTIGEKTIPIQQAPIDQPLALIFGSEWEGVSKKAVEASDIQLTIPMYGFTQSFNISVATGICLCLLRNKLEESGKEYQLDEEEKWKTKVRWAKNSIPLGNKILEQYLKNINS